MAAKAAPKKNPSALKRVRQAEKSSDRNQSVLTSIKTYVKKLDAAIAENDQDKIGKALKEAIVVLTKAAAKGVIHKNTASRKVSRATKKASAAVSKKA
ncbi:MAG: 30S ribosomal protein S20 [Nitrospirae bacterium]|nr:30S ribosomal protein S20 [Nitrospirota bacterium]